MALKMQAAVVEQFGQPLSAVNQVLDRLSHGDVASRVVLDFATR